MNTVSFSSRKAILFCFAGMKQLDAYFVESTQQSYRTNLCNKANSKAVLNAKKIEMI